MRFLPIAILCAVLAGCAEKIPAEALRWTPETMGLRQLQTRRFDTNEEKKLLSASAAVLQDLGFTMDESESGVGLIVASKNRSARETGKMVGSILLGVVTAATGSPVLLPWDEKQEIRVSLVTRPHGEDSVNTLVRVTFQRVVWNNQEKVSKLEQLTDARMYQEFFEKLSKSVFLEGHRI